MFLQTLQTINKNLESTFNASYLTVALILVLILLTRVKVAVLVSQSASIWYSDRV